MNRGFRLLGFVFLLSMIAGCVSLEKEEVSDEISFVVMDEDEIPEEMKSLIEEKKEEPFRITYEEEKYVYIGQGYGKKEFEGYEIEVDQCRVSEHFLYVHTILTGPDQEPKEKKNSWPYIVIRVNENGKKVVFLN